MSVSLRLALNADTTPLSISDELVFKSLEERAREAAEAGFRAVNVDRAEPALTPSKVRRILDRFQLEAASGFFEGHFYDPSQQDRIHRNAVAQAQFSKEIGQDCLFVSVSQTKERHRRAGRIEPGRGTSLSSAQFKQMAMVLEKTAATWLEAGIRLCFHPHVATYVEAPHEVDRLMALTDPDLGLLGPDTGHLSLGGGDPIAIVDHYFSRLGGIHLKDIDPEVAQRARVGRLDYRQACGEGVWTELGAGSVDFPSLFELLRRRGWSGWVIVETDHTRLETALASSRASRAYLRERIGL